MSIFEYKEIFYNRKGLHHSLGYVSPDPFGASLNEFNRGAHHSWGRQRLLASSR